MSQSPKMLAAVQVKDMMSPRRGLPSFLAKVLRHGPSIEGTKKTEYQNM